MTIGSQYGYGVYDDSGHVLHPSHAYHCVSPITGHHNHHYNQTPSPTIAADHYTMRSLESSLPMQMQPQHHMNGDHPMNHMMTASANSPMPITARGHRSFTDGHHPMDLSSPQPQPHYDHMNHRHYRNHSHEDITAITATKCAAHTIQSPVIYKPVGNFLVAQVLVIINGKHRRMQCCTRNIPESAWYEITIHAIPDLPIYQWFHLIPIFL
ncbi:unnamed protein product [Oppiella nova]|uniref:Uncharacterized protein n=1 Tax=Oppiella nova TaxID=334625 RepID=A0A7R9MA40_9ACAR|nr:unnamed protein product [Oppiella nova]CAG2172471.1 unnamed protein product [Oppiella nova]